MSRLRGRLDCIREGHLIGWAVNLDDPTDKLNVVALIEGRVVGAGRADRWREDLASKRIGDGAHGFCIDLTALTGQPFVAHILTECGWPVPGSPLRHGARRNGRIDYWFNGEIGGWAHGDGFVRTRLEVFRQDELLFAWPCDRYRADLERSNIGDGHYGFAIPLARLCGNDVRDLSFRIEGATLPLEAPVQDRSRAQIAPDCRLTDRYADATEARQELLNHLAPAKSGAGGEGVRLSFRAFQNVLNELSFYENRVLDEKRRLALLDRRNDASPHQRQGWSKDALALAEQFDRLCAEAQSLKPDELKQRIENQLLPLYAQHREVRGVLAELARRCGDRVLLNALIDVFLTHSYLRLPAVAFATNLRANAEPNSFDALRLRHLESWVNCIHLTTTPERRRRKRDNGRRRALYVTWSSLPHDTNGYCMRTHYLRRALRQIGEHVIGVTRLGYPWDSDAPRAPSDMIETIDDVTYVRLGGPRANRKIIPLEAYVLECADRIAQAAEIAGADLIHSASNWMAGMPALIAARQTGRPFCYEVRGVWEITRASTQRGYEASDHYELFHAMETRTACEADLVLTITSQVGDEMIRRGVDPARIRLAPNGVDTERFKPRPEDRNLRTELAIGDETVFGFIGSFAQYEGLIDACRAAVKLRDRRIPFKLLLVGDGAVFEEVKSFCREHHLDRSVILPGRVPFNEAPRYYSIVDVALCPRTPAAVTEMVAPLKPFEAMAMGKPVIGSDVAPLAEIIADGATGWLFPKGDIDALAGVMENIVADRDCITRISEAARERVVRCHDWRAVARRLVSAWAELRASTSNEDAVAIQTRHGKRC